jgi:trehalose/maltose hydrolase-like predicted phosphorylase
VMGPDEYHDAYPDADKPGLDNNAYTNVMAVWALLKAREALEAVPAYRREELWDKLALRQEELQHWEEITRKMRVPFHGDGIISQFEGYSDLTELDWAGYRQQYGDLQRLDRILEAEGDTPNRYQVSKQADVLMLFFLLSSHELGALFDRLGYEFPPETIPRTIDYYLQRTAHGSTLSRVVHAWVLARSDRQRSWDLFLRALASDITDIQGGTTPEGIHLGAMAGTVDMVQRGYTGLVPRHDVLWVNPALPAEIRSISFEVVYRGCRLDFHLTPEDVSIQASPDATTPVAIGISGKVVELQPGATETWAL